MVFSFFFPYYLLKAGCVFRAVVAPSLTLLMPSPEVLRTEQDACERTLRLLLESGLFARGKVVGGVSEGTVSWGVGT